jgi:hypothetical protein
MEIVVQGTSPFVRLGIESWRVRWVNDTAHTTAVYDTPVEAVSDGQIQRHTYYPAGKHTERESASFSVAGASWMVIYSGTVPLRVYLLAGSNDTLSEVLLALHAIMNASTE